VLVPVYSEDGALGLVPSLGEGEEEEEEEEGAECILLLLPVGRVGKKATTAGRDGGAIREVIQKPPSPARASVEPDTRSSMPTKQAWVKRRKRRPPTAATGIYQSRFWGACTLATGCVLVAALPAGPRLLRLRDDVLPVFVVRVYWIWVRWWGEGRWV